MENNFFFNIFKYLQYFELLDAGIKKISTVIGNQ